MCGFAGAVVWDERKTISADLLAAMSARVAHRGPDGEGVFINHSGGATPERPIAAMAHRRLAIIDPDPRGNQPFRSADGRLALVFNGEIYNHRELRGELAALRPGYEWRTQCDTEVLLVAYDVWRDECVDHLNGMFAFAAWDETEGTLFLARDRMGQKPLYVASVTVGAAGSSGAPFLFPGASAGIDAIAFASEIGALMPIPWVDRNVDNEALVRYLRWGFLPSPLTIYEGVSQIRPGETLALGRSLLRQRRYFVPAIQGRRTHIGDENAVARTRELVTAAVRRQLVADVPLGCLLSGGIDSSVIAAAMRASVPRDQAVHTFSIGFDDARYDETAHAAEVARHLGTEHHAFTVRPDAAADLLTLAEVFGEPFGDSSALPTHYLARETRQFVKVALSGDGGDELFGGYDRYRAVAISDRVARLPLTVRSLFSSMSQALPRGKVKSKRRRISKFATTLALSTPQRYAAYLQIMDEPLLTALLRDNTERDLLPESDWCSDLFEETHLANLGHGDAVTTALATDRQMYLPDDLLTKVDRASMLHALEVRSPFMDHELVHFAMALSREQLLKGGKKRMLREAFGSDLPASVFARPKMGFAVPIGDWFRDDAALRDMLQSALTAKSSFAADHFDARTIARLLADHLSDRVDYTHPLFALLMLELWWMQHRATV